MGGWLILALAIVASGAPARYSVPPTTEDDTTICVGSPQWRPSSSDAAQIESVPVPAGYRALFESRPPCLEWEINQDNLVGWHLRFGSEPSITAALADVEQAYRRIAPPAAGYRDALERAWRDAQRDLHAAHEVRQPEHANVSAQAQFVEASRTIRRLQALLQARESFIFLARNYLRAAEEFGSLALLDRAALYLRPALEGAAFLEPLEHRPPVAGVIYFNLQTYRTDDLRMREAVLRAHLTRRTEDMARAEAVLQSVERPLYRRLGEAAFSGGDDFCDIGRGASGADELEAACGADDEMQERVVPYWVNRAMLGYVLPPAESRDDELALRLLAQERLPDRGRCCGSRTDDDLFRLYRMRADQQRRAFVEAAAGDDWSDTQQRLYEALDALEKAERLTRPAEAPARFRRVAQAWLDLWARGGEIRPDPNVGVPPLTQSPEHRRYASYLRQLLAGLDRIATGSDPGLPPTAN